MATLYTSNGATTRGGINVSLPEVDAKLRSRAHVANEFTHTSGDKAPKFEPVTTWHEYLLLRVYESLDKTPLFPKAGYYHLKGLSVRDVDFLLEPQDDPP